MENKGIEIIKSSGNKVFFSIDKLKNSLRRSGANDNLVEKIVQIVQNELYNGITTKEIYNRAFALLKKHKSIFASKYKLKKAIYELGPTGFPFEKFIHAVMQYSGYSSETNIILNGFCVKHEVDVVALKNNLKILIECKFHSEEGRNCNVKVPLYIHSRYTDIKKHFDRLKKNNLELDKGWVVTNTRFTEDALAYGKCADLFLLSWDYPYEDGLKDRIDRLGLYPITVSTILTNRDKQFLLSRDVVLCRQLIKDKFYLDYLGMSEIRKKKVLEEIDLLCNY
ncbi:hypothetical protein GGR42_002652 [Saonia flava]|uniref:ATP-cone domain-containing protein n=1 Tax=Saonia flava TaxID=523696 RepID=A0A846QV67_9FLAO|nr:ATP cone domain-containing protein [Saonia flava]NJB72161.1 hypothetical protein [Saonia flava]